MKEAVKVSVLMSVYNPNNSEHFFQAVRSIINQTFSDWEMILYNDGSDERYESVIQEAVAMDDRIRYLKGRENLGLAHALNACLAVARGKYTARMDDDDVSHSERLRKMYEFLEAHKEYQWVGSNTELINDAGRWGVRKMPEIPDKKDFLNYSPYIHPSVMFRRELLEECGGYRISRRGEDYELFMRLHGNGYQGYNIQQELFQYREDASTYKHRKYLYQIEEVGIRFRGFRQLGILGPAAMLHVIKPLIVGVLPYRFLVAMKRRVRKEMRVEKYEGRDVRGEI